MSTACKAVGINDVVLGMALCRISTVGFKPVLHYYLSASGLKHLIDGMNAIVKSYECSY